MKARLAALLQSGELDLPFPGGGETPRRHRALSQIARRDLPLARLAEAHADAAAILADCGRRTEPGLLYGVWASESPSQTLRLNQVDSSHFAVQGSKMFCTGAGIVDRALITVQEPERRLIEVDLRANAASIRFDCSGWVTPAFSETQTATTVFDSVVVTRSAWVGDPGWYLSRPGFWHGALGPASCWAGGAIGLVDYAIAHSKNDPHAAAHLGGMHSDVWLMNSCLDAAGREIDEHPQDSELAIIRALTVRHLIEQACRDILARFGRAFGPRPLAFDEQILRRYQEVELYVRQSHAEHDLELLGRSVGRNPIGRG